MAKTQWVLDPAHSEVQFKVRHMMISNVTGHFKNFDASVTTDGDDLTTAHATFTADISSVTTNNEQRDGHLKSADFFDLENHPQLKFESTKLEKVSDEDYKLHGDLTLRGVTKPITLNVEFGGQVVDPWGNERVGFVIEGKLNRKEYGLMWSSLTEAGGVVVSDDVKLHVAVEFVKQKEAVTA